MRSQMVAATAHFGGSCAPLSGVAGGLTLRVDDGWVLPRIVRGRHQRAVAGEAALETSSTRTMPNSARGRTLLGEARLRCASTRTAGRRPTSDPVLTSPARHPWWRPTRTRNRSSDVRISGDLDRRDGDSGQGRPEPEDEQQSRSCERGEGEGRRHGGSLHSGELARTRRTEPTTRRMPSNPIPGQPPANVE